MSAGLCLLFVRFQQESAASVNNVHDNDDEQIHEHQIRMHTMVGSTVSCTRINISCSLEGVIITPQADVGFTLS